MATEVGDTQIDSDSEESLPDSEAQIRSELLEVLTSVSARGATFACGEEISTYPKVGPQIDVDGVGRLAFPLCLEQAATLSKAGEVAPFGLGSNTLVDEKVRRSKQIDAAKVMCVRIIALISRCTQRASLAECSALQSWYVLGSHRVVLATRCQRGG